MNHQFNFLFFDLFGVLIGTDQSAVTHYVATQLNIPYVLVRDILYGSNLKQLERRKINFTQYFSDIQHALPGGRKLQFEGFKNRWVQIGLNELPAAGLLPELTLKYRILILSNTSNRMIRKFKTQFSFFDNLEGVITSEEAGVMKPAPGIFTYALEKFQAVPDQCVMIDDSPSNVKAAENLGMVGHCYTNFEGLTQFLNQLLE